VLSFLFFFPLAMAIGGASFKLLKASLWRFDNVAITSNQNPIDESLFVQMAKYLPVALFTLILGTYYLVPTIKLLASGEHCYKPKRRFPWLRRPRYTHPRRITRDNDPFFYWATVFLHLAAIILFYAISFLSTIMFVMLYYSDS
jgi:hypothetical protein